MASYNSKGQIALLQWVRRHTKRLVRVGYLVAGWMFWFTWREGSLNEGFVAGLGDALPFLVLGWILFLGSRRIHLWSGQRLLAVDDRPRVLYLRSFDADKVDYPDDKTMWYPGYPVSFEEEISEALWEVGPPEAVAEPDKEQPLGFIRSELEDADWKPQVTKRLEEASLVVVLIGETQGLLWEVREALQTVEPERLLLAIPPKGYEGRSWATGNLCELSGACGGLGRFTDGIGQGSIYRLRCES